MVITGAARNMRRLGGYAFGAAACLGLGVGGLAVTSTSTGHSSTPSGHRAHGVTVLPAAATVAASVTLENTKVTAIAAAGEPAKVLDGDASTAWTATPERVGGRSVELHLLTPTDVSGLVYQPSTQAGAGRVGRFEVSVTADGTTWGAPVATGTWADDASEKQATFATMHVLGVRLTALDEAGDRTVAVSVGDLRLLGASAAAGAMSGSATTLSAVRLSSAATVTTSLGSWGPTITFPLVPAAAALLPNNKVLVWSAASTTDWAVGSGFTETAILDLATSTVSRKTVVNTGHDMFCPGVAILADGRIMVTGGVDAGATSIYDTSTGTWVKGPPMNIPRGYQGMTTLADGSVFTIGGSWGPNPGGKDAEVWTVDGGWRRLTTVPVTPIMTNDPKGAVRADNHAWLFPMSNGRLLHAGPSAKMNWITTAGTGSIVSAGTRADSADAMNGNAVMYDADKLLTVAGSPAYDNTPATNRSYVVDASGPGNPIVTRSGDLQHPRTFNNSVVLADGSVLVVGGQPVPVAFTDTNAAVTPELWSSSTGLFTSLAPQATPRTYHSWAIGLPDGRVISGGGGLCGSCTTNHADAQIFTPPYLLNADGTLRARPAITSAPPTAAAGTTIPVITDRAVSGFSLVRYGEATHSVNNDQRRVSLPMTATGTNSYAVTVPADKGVMLAGPWMLFALDANGTPSVAATINVPLPGGESAAQFAPASPASIPIGATNIALRKPATQSSTDANNAGAGRAVDGNTDGRWSNGSVTHTAETEMQAWWQVDLGKVTPLSAVQLWNRTDCCADRLTNFSLLASAADMTGRTYADLSSDPSVSITRISAFGATPNAVIAMMGSARYVRVQLSSVGGARPLSLAEVQVFNVPQPPVVLAGSNIAIGRPATQSSVDANNAGAGRAVDGNTDGRWSNGSVTHTNLEAQPWWQLDLGTIVPASGVILWNRTDCCTDRLSNGTVFLSSIDPGAKSFSQLNADATVTKIPFTTLTGANLTLAAPAGTNARYIRVQLSGTNILSLAELQLFSTTTPPPPSGTNLAAGKPSVQSSMEVNNAGAGRAVDGNTSGVFANGSVTHTDLQTQPWWQVDLGVFAAIGSVVLWNRTDACCASRLFNGTVFLSASDPGTRTYADLTADPAVTKLPYTTFAGASLALSVPTSVSARYVRVQLSGTNVLSLAEVQVIAR